MAKIYTKTGDAGETSIFGGKRLPKDHVRIEAYGTVDELNAYLGLLRDQVPDPETQSRLKMIQDRLFTVGSNLASDPDKELVTPDLRAEDIEGLEKEMDRMNEDLPELRNFVLPGGHQVVSYCHLARCVCRRAERRVIHLARESKVEPIVIQYLNRLSDYFFVLARYLGREMQVEEISWSPRS
jgi:cob(I)alamin adenosyltransferase